MTKKLIVGYRTDRRTKPERISVPDFEAMCPKSFTGDKRAARIAEDKAKWEAALSNQPYTGHLVEVHLIDPSNKKAETFAPKPKVSVTHQVCDYLKEHYPKAWPADILEKYVPEVAVLGFNPRHFLKMLGLTASLPAVGCSLPPAAWFGNADHRDIEAALMPSDYSFLDWELVIEARRIGLSKQDAAHYDDVLEDWTGPGTTTAQQDAEVAAIFAGQLKFI